MSEFQKKLEAMRLKKEQEQQQMLQQSNARLGAIYPQAQVSPSGLHYVVLEAGNGQRPKKHQKVSIHYTGKLEDGTVFDSSLNRGTPFEFEVEKGGVIQGLDEGIQLLTEQGKALLIIPWFLAYGASGKPPLIPPHANLLFEVALLRV